MYFSCLVVPVLSVVYSGWLLVGISYSAGMGDCNLFLELFNGELYLFEACEESKTIYIKYIEGGRELAAFY